MTDTSNTIMWIITEKIINIEIDRSDLKKLLGIVKKETRIMKRSDNKTGKKEPIGIK
jgi:hypothetical protein